VFQWAVKKVKPSFQDSTWQAFWHTSVRGMSTREVAATLGVTEGAVYISKCRVLKRLKEVIAEHEQE
jgi:RNA polymerase sigma-70 factor (ECF subfamily)